MRTGSRVVRRVGGIAVVVVLSVVSGRMASATEPPPPSFWNFTITNSTGQDVSNLTVKLFPHVKDHYDQIDTAHPCTLTVSSLANGVTVGLGMPKLYGIAQITASGQCPAQHPAVNVTITATQGPFMQNSPPVYAGFTPESPTTPNGDFPPRLEFYSQNGQFHAKLQAKSRWDMNWDAEPKVDDQPFP
jgi:hypothetical protein